MTWCAKIYDIFNGWADAETTLALEPASFRTLHSSADIDPNLTDGIVIQHDSPFSEKSDARVNGLPADQQLFNIDYLNYRDYRGEHLCADTLLSCHQSDGHYYSSMADERPYGIATISNTSLNLAEYMGNTEDKFQEQKQQQLTRSFSLDIPMELRRAHFSLPAIDDLQPRERSSLNHPRIKADASNRLSLNAKARPSSAQQRQDSFGHRVSTRSSYSVPDYDPQDISSRNNDQVDHEVQCRIKEMFHTLPNGVYPMIYRLPPSGEGDSYNDHYRIEGGYGEPSQWQMRTKISPVDCRISTDNIASLYHHSFFEQTHRNFYAIDHGFNPVVMSIKSRDEVLSVIVRTKEGSKAMEFVADERNATDFVYLSQQLCPNLQIEHFEECSHDDSVQLIKTFDEKLEIQKFKFGVIYQRQGQTTEEEFFSNQQHQRTFDEFLEIIATRVSLKNFKGYRAGLDVSDQTDSPISYYEHYDQKEIMFHVSTLLPFTPNDSSQIQRKRHIGNDIVAIVFQEENTPFHPSMIKSNFLHVFLVVQPVQILSRTCYKMMLVARDDIAEFSPMLYPNIVYLRTAEQLKPFILSKLINAEYAAYRCRTFALLQERTRCSFLKTLCEHVSEKAYETLCDEQKRSSHRRSSILSNPSRRRYLSSMKKIFTRSHTLPDGRRESIKSEQMKNKLSKKLVRSGKSVDVEDSQRSSGIVSSSDHESTRETDLTNRYREGRSDDSVTSNDDRRASMVRPYSSQQAAAAVYYGDESDEGLDSMSSVDTTRVPYDSDDQDAYRQQLREKSHPAQIWHRISNQRHILMPETAGIHLNEASTV